jgi:hypothetical protein
MRNQLVSLLKGDPYRKALTLYIGVLKSASRNDRLGGQRSSCDGGARAMERGSKISISYLIEYKAKEERGGEGEKY